MTVGLSLARLLVIVAGIAIAVLGLYLIALPGGPGTIVGIYTVLGGLALIVGAVIERVRYRSGSSVDGTQCAFRSVAPADVLVAA